MRRTLFTPAILGFTLGCLAIAYTYRKNFIFNSSLKDAMNRGEDLDGRELLRSAIKENKTQF